MIPKHLETQYHSHIGEYEKREVMGAPTDGEKTLENWEMRFKQMEANWVS